MKIIIQTIPHKKQRYPTCGDWIFDEKGNLKIFVSKTNEKYEFLVALHELIEVFLCKERGITQEQVDKFDIEFEKNREDGNFDEPGNDSYAPYAKEHKFATMIEKLMSYEINVNWEEYDKTINSL